MSSRLVAAQGADGDDALVRLGDAHGVQLAPVAVRDRDAALPREARDVAQRPVGLAAGDVELVDGPPGAQGLQYRVAALYYVVFQLVHVGPH